MSGTSAENDSSQEPTLVVTQEEWGISVTRTFWIAVLLVICLPLVGWLAVYGYVLRQEQLRIADAQPVFDPVLPLRAELLSNPCASRFCCYWLRFPSDSFLNDDNVAQLESLNKLAAENELSLVVETRAVTDKSLRVLMSLRTVDYLDLTKSGVSDDGLEQLSAGLPDTVVA